MDEVRLYVTKPVTRVNMSVTDYFSEFIIAGLDPAIHGAGPLHGPPAQASEATPFCERLCPVVTRQERLA
jgi:hypothetical protein